LGKIPDKSEVENIFLEIAKKYGVFEKSVFKLLIEKSLEETAKKMNSLTTTSPIPDDKTTEKASASVRLLELMQIDFLQTVQRIYTIKQTNNTYNVSEIESYLKSYVEEIFFRSNELLKHALKVNSEIFQSTSLDSRILFILKNSIIGTSLIYLIGSLLLLFQKNELSHLALFLLKKVQSLEITLLDLQKFDVESKGSEQSDREKTTKRNERKKDYVIVESKHNYPPNWDFEKEISIPGSSHLLVTFDPKCATEDSQDILQLYCVENGEKKTSFGWIFWKSWKFSCHSSCDTKRHRIF